MYASSYTTVPIARYYVLKYNVKPLHCKSLRHIQIIYYFEEYDVYNLIGVYEEYEEYDMA